MTKRPQKYDTLTNRGVTPEQAAVAAALVPLDKVAIEVEGRWGFGVLERLVSPETAAKFASAKVKLDLAVEGEDPVEVAKRAAIMIKGWRALEAEAGGYERDPMRYWFVAPADGGKPYCFVNDGDAVTAAKDFRDHRVWSMDEVVRVLASHELTAVQAVKDKYPAATVERVGKPTIDWKRGEEIPW